MGFKTRIGSNKKTKMMEKEEKISEFKEYLQTMGYNKASVSQLPVYVKEFLNSHNNIELSAITAEHIKTFHEYLQQRPNRRSHGGLSQSRIAHYLYSLRLFFNYLEMTEQIGENPMSRLTFPSPQSAVMEILTQEEIKELYNSAQTLRDRAILGIIYGCGLRKTEAEKLDINDIHFRNQLLYIREGKGKKRRVIPMTARIAEDLKNYYLHERSSYIKTTCMPEGASTGENQKSFILNKRGGRMKGAGYYVRIKELIQLTKNPELKTKNIGLHSLRHSIATHLLENGLTIEYVRDFLGHQFLETTQIYTKISEKQLLQLTSNAR